LRTLVIPSTQLRYTYLTPSTQNSMILDTARDFISWMSWTKRNSYR
jgi:hypothetical protein